MNNRQRSTYGFKAVNHGTPDFGANGRDEDGLRTDVCDTLANILHYCDAHGIDFDRALDSARNHHGAEVVEDDIEAAAKASPPSRCVQGHGTGVACDGQQCAACPYRFDNATQEALPA